MTSDLDIYRSANLLVKRHGAQAPIEAAMRADAMLGKGDLDGRAVPACPSQVDIGDRAGMPLYCAQFRTIEIERYV